ncbi:MAG: hypothetical protein JO314_05515 [Acidobacteria bacterium]|nr:hypothetical protein [Acidobacteriota bacterium]
MPTFRIVIRGIGLVYNKNGKWKTLFPFAGGKDCHQVILKHDEKDTGVPLAAANRIIEIKANNPSRSSGEGPGLDTFINLTGQHAHDRGLGLVGKWESNSTALVIGDAVLSLEEMTKCRYALVGGSTGQPVYAEVGYSAIAEIVADSISLTAGVEAEAQVFDKSQTLIFDNTCNGKWTSDNGDLTMLYEHVIADRIVSTRRFVIERDPTQDPKGPLPKSAEKILDNPPPGHVGLPCNLFLARNNQDLW